MQHLAGRVHHLNLDLEQGGFQRYLVSGWWPGTGLQTTRFGADSGVYLFVILLREQDLTHNFVVKSEHMQFYVVSIFPEKLKWQIWEARAETRAHIKLCVRPLSLTSCLVRVSLCLSEFRVTFHLLLRLLPILLSLCATVSASANSIGSQSATLYRHENKEQFCQASMMKEDV